MNEKFYSLPEEKRQKIINAGFYVFSGSSYRKAPVAETAKEAGISKALLFHYFKNKKEFYLFLWDEAVKRSVEILGAEEILNQKDFFSKFEEGMKRKLKMMKEHPYLTGFILRALNEQEEEISVVIQKKVNELVEYYNMPVIGNIEKERFLPGIDFDMMYREMYWASEGYLSTIIQSGNMDMEQAEKGFGKLLEFWKSVYLRREAE